MTKKDYEIIQASFSERRKAINDNGEGGTYTRAEFRVAHHTVDMLAIELGYTLEAHDNRFKARKFLVNCGVKSELLED